MKKDGLLQQYHLDGRRFQFRLLPIGETDAELSYYLSGYQKLKEYLRHWDMEKEESEFIFRTIAAILLIGELEFDGGNTATVQNPDVLNKGFILMSQYYLIILNNKLIRVSSGEIIVCEPGQIGLGIVQ